jgi:hypothetical protein
MKKFVVLFLACTIAWLSEAQTVVRKEGKNWQLLVDTKPFDIKGVTFGEEVMPQTIGRYLRDLQFLGVNTIRTWGTNEATQVLLDSAHAYNIKVMVGIWLRHGRPGMEGDDQFDYLNDQKGMDDMYHDALNTVNRYKNHPAVLFWGVGNEVYLNIATDAEKLAYSHFLEKVCHAIKQADPNHPICSVEAWTFGLDWWKKHVPSVDIYGLNIYGSAVDRIPEELANRQIDKPYVITEYGVRGEWDAQEDKNGLKTEPSDQEKYTVIASGYHDWIRPKPACLGVYVFHYGNSQDFGASWLLLYFDGSYRPAYWATREAFAGKKPTNEIPVIHRFVLPDTVLPSGKWVPVGLSVSDKENENLTISFHYNQRTGSRARRDQIVPLEHRGSLKEGFELKLPDESGLLKVYAFAKDPYGNLGIAHTSFVLSQRGSGDFVPGARTQLPFSVYYDHKNLPYAPTAYMGDFQNLKVDMQNKEHARSGKESMKLYYDAAAGWYGFGLVDPAGDWGDRPGGYNLSGAKKFSFWAKASVDEVVATVGYGLIGKDKPYYDTDRQSNRILLTNQWKKYEIDLKNTDLRCIRSGFVLYSNGIGQPFSIWIDEVMFE